jgi:hypothetical protein
MIVLLVKLGDPMDRTLWGMASVVAHVQVTVPLTATVSTAGLDDPLWSLLKKRAPPVTAAVAAAGDALLGGGVGVLGGGVAALGAVAELLQPASRLATSPPLISSIVT